VRSHRILEDAVPPQRGISQQRRLSAKTSRPAT
jgi:hypothetical protein